MSNIKDFLGENDLPYVPYNELKPSEFIVSNLSTGVAAIQPAGYGPEGYPSISNGMTEFTIPYTTIVGSDGMTLGEIGSIKHIGTRGETLYYMNTKAMNSSNDSAMCIYIFTVKASTGEVSSLPRIDVTDMWDETMHIPSDARAVDAYVTDMFIFVGVIITQTDNNSAFNNNYRSIVILNDGTVNMHDIIALPNRALAYTDYNIATVTAAQYDNEYRFSLSIMAWDEEVGDVPKGPYIEWNIFTIDNSGAIVARQVETMDVTDDTTHDRLVRLNNHCMWGPEDVAFDFINNTITLGTTLGGGTPPHSLSLSNKNTLCLSGNTWILNDFLSASSEEIIYNSSPLKGILIPDVNTSFLHTAEKLTDNGTDAYTYKYRLARAVLLDDTLDETELLYEGNFIASIGYVPYEDKRKDTVLETLISNVHNTKHTRFLLSNDADIKEVTFNETTTGTYRTYIRISGLFKAGLPLLLGVGYTTESSPFYDTTPINFMDTYTFEFKL